MSTVSLLLQHSPPPATPSRSEIPPPTQSSMLSPIPPLSQNPSSSSELLCKDPEPNRYTQLLRYFNSSLPRSSSSSQPYAQFLRPSPPSPPRSLLSPLRPAPNATSYPSPPSASPSSPPTRSPQTAAKRSPVPKYASFPS